MTLMQLEVLLVVDTVGDLDVSFKTVILLSLKIRRKQELKRSKFFHTPEPVSQLPFNIFGFETRNALIDR